MAVKSSLWARGWLKNYWGCRGWNRLINSDKLVVSGHGDAVSREISSVGSLSVNRWDMKQVSIPSMTSIIWQFLNTLDHFMTLWGLENLTLTETNRSIIEYLWEENRTLELHSLYVRKCWHNYFPYFLSFVVCVKSIFLMCFWLGLFSIEVFIFSTKNNDLSIWSKVFYRGVYIICRQDNDLTTLEG